MNSRILRPAYSIIPTACTVLCCAFADLFPTLIDKGLISDVSFEKPFARYCRYDSEFQARTGVSRGISDLKKSSSLEKHFFVIFHVEFRPRYSERSLDIAPAHS